MIPVRCQIQDQGGIYKKDITNYLMREGASPKLLLKLSPHNRQFKLLFRPLWETVKQMVLGSKGFFRCCSVPDKHFYVVTLLFLIPAVGWDLNFSMTCSFSTRNSQVRYSRLPRLSLPFGTR